MKKVVVLSLITLFLASCSSDKGGKNNGGENVGSVTFNRKAMLTHWADNLIIPAFKNYNNSIDNLNNKVEAFSEEVNKNNLLEVRKALTDAYMQWQTVAFYEVGPSLERHLVPFTNTYPTNVEIIKKNIEKGGNYQLHLFSQSPQQGLPAMDYLVNGIASGDDNIVSAYKGNTGEKNRKYLVAVSSRLKEITGKVLNDWEKNYRQTFISNDGSSSTASVDAMGNAYMLYYEKYMRNGKVRFPSGATIGNESYPNKVESLYNPELSLPLLIKSLESLQNFFNGRTNASEPYGLGFKQYLDKYNEVKKGEDIAGKINGKFNDAITMAKKMKDQGTLYNLIETNRDEVIGLHDVINSNVINLKTDMFQALNIQVVYVDGDGD